MTPIHVILVLDSLTHCPVMNLRLEIDQNTHAKGIFSHYLSLHCVLSLSASLKWLPSLLYQSKTVFTSNSLLSLSKPFLSVLFQYRPIKSLEVSRWQPPLHTCWISMASMYVSSYIWEAFPQLTVELCVILPPALLKTHLWVLRQGDNS